MATKQRLDVIKDKVSRQKFNGVWIKDREGNSTFFKASIKAQILA